MLYLNDFMNGFYDIFDVYSNVDTYPWSMSRIPNIIW